MALNPDAETMAVILNRGGPNQSWGFRLQGGSDFTTPLSVQLVNPGSIAEQYGLRAGDAVLQINGQNTHDLEHEQAKQIIVQAGNQVHFLIQRGIVKIWKPKVTPGDELKAAAPYQTPASSYGPSEDVPYVQHSLAADKQEFQAIGSAHNRSARPFPGFGGGSSIQTPPAPPPAAPGLTHSQYNTPMPVYSGQNVSDTYQSQSQAASYQQYQPAMANLSISDTPQSSQAKSPTFLAVHEAESPNPVSKATSKSPTYLAVHGIDSETPSEITRSRSPTFMAVHGLDERDNKGVVDTTTNNNKPKTGFDEETKTGEEIRYRGYSDPSKQSRSFRLLEQGLSEAEVGEIAGEAPVARPPGMRSVQAPVAKPPSEKKQAQYMTCKGCNMLVTGVFVKIKGEPFHPECFKCFRCGKNLKNQGYFTVESQMYCDTCARQVAAPPAQDMVAVPVYR